ncbi:YjiH family protein [Bacillus sp. FSL W7-1360]
MGKPIQLKYVFLFVMPSLVGIFLFMTPLPDDKEGILLPVTIAAKWLQGQLGESVIISIVTWLMVGGALVTLITTLFKPRMITENKFYHGLFVTTIPWLVVRIIGALFAVLVSYGIGPEFLLDEGTGALLLKGLLPFLFAIFLFAGLLMPLLLNFGLMEFIGMLLRKFMRPLFRLPGRASVDTMASWVGDGTVGIMLSDQQYRAGAYTEREAAIVASTFSVVSITFSIYILSELNISHLFWSFFLTLFVAGLIAAFIMPRIPPLSRKKDVYIDGSPRRPEPAVKGVFSAGLAAATARAAENADVGKNVKSGISNVLGLWLGVLPVVMAIGTLATIAAEYTPLFEWLGMPFIPLLEWMNVPQAAEASQTLLVGFTDMLLPTIMAGTFGITNEFTLFVIATLSVSQLIYMSETGGVLIAAKIPVSFLDCVWIFLLRTVITLPIIVLMAHLLL